MQQLNSNSQLTMNPPTPAAMEREARGKPSFLRWRAQIENAKGTESVNERTYKYSGKKFVWGGDNQEDEERRLLIRIISVTNRNRKPIAGEDADAELGSPKKKRRRLERDEALPLVCSKPAWIKWQALGNGVEMEYKKRKYVKGVHGMEEKLMTAMVNNTKKASSDRGCSGGDGGGGGGGNGNGHSTDAHACPSNSLTPAIYQKDIEGTSHDTLDAANCNNDFYDGMTVTGGPDNTAKEENNEFDVFLDASNSIIKTKRRQRILEVRATKIRDARKRYFERFERNGSWEGASLSLLALEDVDSLMKTFGGMGGGGEEEVGDSYLNGGLLVEEEGTGPLNDSGDKESIASTTATTNKHDGGDPDLIAIVDELFHDVVIEEMTTKSFYCLVGDCVGQDRMNKKVKRTIKERLNHLMEEERRKGGSKASATTREEDKKEKERRSTRGSKPTEKMAEYLGRKKRGLKSGEHTEKNDGSNSGSEYEKFKSSNPHPMANEEGDGVEYRRRSKRQQVRTDKMAIFQTGKDKGSSAAATTRHDMGREEVGGIGTEGDLAEEVRENISRAPSTSLPHDFYVGQLVNVIEGKASYQASIQEIQNEQATVRWTTWGGFDVVQVNRLRPIWDGSPRKRKQTDLYGFSQLKSATTSTRIQKRLPMRHYRKLQMLEEQPEITQEAEESKELLGRGNPNPPQVEKKLEDAEDRKLPMLEEQQTEITQEAEESTLPSPPAPSKIWHCPECTYPNWWDLGGGYLQLVWHSLSY